MSTSSIFQSFTLSTEESIKRLSDIFEAEDENEFYEPGKGVQYTILEGNELSKFLGIMPIYNFDNPIDRENTFSVKWDYPKKLFPESDLKPLPLWVADMDFPCSEEIISALKKRLDNLVLGYTLMNIITQ